MMLKSQTPLLKLQVFLVLVNNVSKMEKHANFVENNQVCRHNFSTRPSHSQVVYFIY